MDHMLHPSDEELVARARKKDKQAFTELFDRYKNRILGYLYRYTHDYHLAEDLTVETFLSVYNNIAFYEEKSKFLSWLYTIATNCAKKELRKKRYRTEVSLDEPIMSEDGKIKLADFVSDEKTRPDYAARENEFKELIYKIVDAMDEKYKSVLLLCDIEGLNYKEAAKTLGINPITVGTRLRRARKALYEALKRYDIKF
ncbi:MAG: sigma-70 family RNA polymerase sigma factor [Candidatus Omnitrophica bacterium]|nr:sigma-70 family RNA polymerase sigma factor [Candidatus Omnitrophota bacterium]